MRFLSCLIATLFLLFCAAWGDEGHHHSLTEDEIGSVQFATSCSPQVAVAFNRAVALLHSFQYEKTREAFMDVAKQDPNCAMAHWGIAMSHYHGLWGNGDMNAGRTAIRKAQEIATATRSTTPREKSYLKHLAKFTKKMAIIRPAKQRP